MPAFACRLARCPVDRPRQSSWRPPRSCCHGARIRHHKVKPISHLLANAAVVQSSLDLREPVRDENTNVKTSVDRKFLHMANEELASSPMNLGRQVESPRTGLPKNRPYRLTVLREYVF